MRGTHLTSVFAIAVLGAACASVSEPGPPGAGSQTSQTTETQLAVRDACKPAGSDPFFLGKLAVDGNELVVDIGTSGGCRPHQLAICWDGISTRSMPPQVRFAVSHNANGDNCEAFLTHPLRVDLAPLFAELPPPVVVYVTGAKNVLDGATDHILIEAR